MVLLLIRFEQPAERVCNRSQMNYGNTAVLHWSDPDHCFPSNSDMAAQSATIEKGHKSVKPDFHRSKGRSQPPHFFDERLNGTIVT
jgi:hypothetical protein